ncbi:MAG: phage baseplate assembly protein V [Sphingobium sp.]
MSALQRVLAPLNHRIQMMVGRAVLAAVNDDTMMQSLQIELAADEAQDGVEHFQPYGFAARPHEGAEAIALAVGGLRSHAVVLTVSDRRYRLRQLRTGEVGLYDDQGQTILIGRDGIVIESAHGVTIATEGDFAVDAQGAVSIRGQGETLIDGATILLGEGASLEAARKTDAVTGSAITGGSGKVMVA